jgi:hypothetical protein
LPLAEEFSSLQENQGGQHILEWQDTVKGVCGGSYQVPLGGNTDKYRFASGKEDHQSYGPDDESLLMSKGNLPDSSNRWC